MNTAPTPVKSGGRRLGRRARITLVLLALALLAAWLLQPQRAGGFLLRRIGADLGLEITAAHIDYGLRGSPRLRLSGLDLRQPGQDKPLLRVEQVQLTLPWATLRSRGTPLILERIELDAPHLNLDALQRWQASRPPSPPIRLPQVLRGLAVRDGRVDGAGWHIGGIAIAAPRLHPQQALSAQLQARYVETGLAATATGTLRIGRPQALLDHQPSPVELRGRVALRGGDWTLPAQLLLSGPLRITEAGLRQQPAKFGLAGEYRSGNTQLPLRIGLHGPLELIGTRLQARDLTAVLSGTRLLPQARARGHAVLDTALELQLDGALESWPAGWPALPQPLARSSTPLDFSLAYAGPPAFDAPATLRLSRGATRFEARFKRTDLSRWLDAGSAGSPLPPLDGHLTTPRLELPGMVLEGVEIELGDAPPAPATP